MNGAKKRKTHSPAIQINGLNFIENPIDHECCYPCSG
jgi:hypothetical protein